MFLSNIQLIDISDLNSKYIKYFEEKSNLDKTYRNVFFDIIVHYVFGIYNSYIK
jgi:hypothetical protein